MFTLPEIFFDENEGYLTKPAILLFATNNSQLKEKFKYKYDKSDMLKEIVSYANSSPESKEKVLNWLDCVAREGIKEIQLDYRELKNEMQILLQNDMQIYKHLNAYLCPNIERHLCGNKYAADEYQFVKYEIRHNGHGKEIIMYFCRKLHFVENKKDKQIVKTVDYPIIVTYYMDKCWLCTRYKTRSGLYIWRKEGYSQEYSTSTTPAKEVALVLETVQRILGLQDAVREQNSKKVKNKLFGLLHQFTYTPIEIRDKIKQHQDAISNITNSLMDICGLSDRTSRSLEQDVGNIVEKYLSIYWPDSDVFTRDREAYPVSLSAIDEENSRVDQTAAQNSPLQSRAVFFDNKKMLYRQKTCENILFFWKRENNIYGKDEFPVRISEDKGKCIFKFFRFTAEEDIEHVLFSVIDA